MKRSTKNDDWEVVFDINPKAKKRAGIIFSTTSDTERGARAKAETLLSYYPEDYLSYIIYRRNKDD